ncbi:MAG: T9SS type A sorting domain-containing protein [Rubricoccaceae bacterium]|nr:T9SS type A sorting domain-containing protein [Rubricoccaceae bacterium]
MLRPFSLIFALFALAPSALGQPEPIREWLFVHGPDAAEISLAADVVVDDVGNAYATGTYAGPGNSGTRDDIIVLKLSPEGDLLWEDIVVASDSYDGGHAVALDGQGHLYVVADERESALLLREYTTGGTLLWQRRYQRDGLGLSASEGPYRLVLDGAGHLYVAATGYGPGGAGSTSADISVARFTTDGVLTWEHVYDGNGDYNQQSVNTIHLAPDGGLYVAGQSATDGFGPKFLVYRLTPDGALAWDLLLSGNDRGGDSAIGLDLGPDGSVYAAGLVDNFPDGTPDAILARITDGGTLLWRREFDNPDFPGNGPDAFRALAVDSQGNAYCAGATWYGFTDQYHDVLTAKYGPDGTLLWWDNVDAPGYTRDIANHVLLNAQEQPIVVAEVKNMQGLNFTHALLKYDADGPLVWAEVGDITTDGFALFNGAALGPGGDLFFAGFSHSPQDTYARLAVGRYRDALAPTVAAQPVGGAVVIPAEGGSFRFTATITNPSDEPMTLDLWTEVEGPVSRSPVVGPRRLTLAPGGSVTRTLRQPIPGTAPPGAYTYLVHAGVYPDRPYGTDAFAFEKQEAPGNGIVLVASDATPQAEFGTAVGLDGDLAIVGAPHTDTRDGAAYLFRRSAGVWQEEALLDDLGLSESDEFGNAVAVSGEVAVVGASQPHVQDAGYAVVYRRTGNAWAQEAVLRANDAQTYDAFGAAVALDGDVLLVGAPQPYGTGPGAAYVFRYDGAQWIEEARLTGAGTVVGHQFGTAVALDGDVAVVGADRHNTGYCGSAFVFRRTGSTWAQEAALNDDACVNHDRFGAAVAVEGDVVVVGAHGDDHGSNLEVDLGAVHVYGRSGGVWTLEARLTAADANDYDHFGSSVGLDGNTLIAGAYGDSEGGTVAGAGYVFRRVNGQWVEERKLLASGTPEAFASFGYAAALDGTTALFGAPEDDEVFADAGAAYVYDVSAAGRSAANPVAASGSTLPARFALTAVAPNPFSATAHVTLDVPEAQRVTVAVFDLLGRRVALLHDGAIEAGTHALVLDGRALPSGVYVVRAAGETVTATRRLTLVR